MMDLSRFVIFLLLQTIYFQIGFCLKWTSLANREVFGENGKGVTLTWTVDLEDKQFLKAVWKTGDLILVFVKEDGSILPRSPATSDNFGVVTIDALDSGYINTIDVEVTATDLSKITDTVTIKYVDASPSFDETKMAPRYDVIENTNSSKNVEMMIKVQADPQPNVFWTLNGLDVSTMSGFQITENVQPVGTVFEVTSTLRIEQLTAEHNGALDVVAKFGQSSDVSPMVNQTATINVKYAPRNIKISHNITNSVMYNSGYIKLDCEAESNPTAHYIYKEGSDILYQGSEKTHVVYIGNFHHKRQLNYLCTANNSIGEVNSNVLEIKIVNGTLLAKRVADENVDWWVYFGVAVAVGLLVFFGFAAILCIMRRILRYRGRLRSVETFPEESERRMRSLNLRQDIDKARMRQDYDRRTAPRTNGASHVYDMNERANRGTATQIPQIDQSKKRPALSFENNNNDATANDGRINDGFDISVYDTVCNN